MVTDSMTGLASAGPRGGLLPVKGGQIGKENFVQLDYGHRSGSSIIALPLAESTGGPAAARFAPDNEQFLSRSEMPKQ
jgi:hypothetical protein